MKAFQVSMLLLITAPYLVGIACFIYGTFTGGEYRAIGLLAMAIGIILINSLETKQWWRNLCESTYQSGEQIDE